MSAFQVDNILVVLKATVDRNINSHCWQDSGSSQNGCRVKEVAEKETLNVADTQFSQWAGPKCEGD